MISLTILLVCKFVRRVKILVLICANDTSVPRIQPYKSTPKGVPRQHPLRGHYRGPHTPNIVLRWGLHPKDPRKRGLKAPLSYRQAPGALSKVRVRAFTMTVSANQDLYFHSPYLPQNTILRLQITINVNVERPWFKADDRSMNLGRTASSGSTEAELPHSNFECLFPSRKSWTEATQLDLVSPK